MPSRPISPRWEIALDDFDPRYVVGGVVLIGTAAKHFERVTVFVDPEQYAIVLDRSDALISRNAVTCDAGLRAEGGNTNSKGAEELAMTAIVHEILLPAGEPDYEWVRGRALQKMSPASVHSFVQGALLRIVSAWALAHKTGRVGPEWRVRILPAGSIERRPLTPDIAFFSKAQLATISRNDDRDVAYPPFAPEIAFEVISKSDETADIEAKRADYLSAGAARVIEVYPASRELRAWLAPDEAIVVDITGTWTDDMFPGLAIRVADLFTEYDAYIADLGE